jgi:hypothetical protein
MGRYGSRENVYLFLGFDMKANPVEILYNEFGENGVNVFHAMTEIEQKTGMTDAECGQWDDYYTKNTFEPGPNLLKQGVKLGFASDTAVSDDTLLLSELDRDVAEYVRIQAQTAHKSQARVINDLIREKIALAL